MAEKDTNTVNEEITSVTMKDLQAVHGDKAAEVYNKIANIGGFGSFGKDHIGADGKPDFPALDLKSLADQLDSGNEKAASEAKSRLAEIKKVLKKGA